MTATAADDLPAGAAARISALESTAADALPCAVLERFDGWRLRCDHGDARRANSVLAEFAGKRALADKIAVAEDFYRRHGRPPRFQISPASQPPQLDARLARRGYRLEPGAAVQVCTPVALAANGDGFAVECGALPSPQWCEVLASVDPGAAALANARAEALAAAGTPAWHCLVGRAGVVMAVGLGVHHGGRLGLFNMATRPEQRRRGAASAVVAALAGRAGPETPLYLQVDARNEGARAFYARLGFTELYRYHYRVLDRGQLGCSEVPGAAEPAGEICGKCSCVSTARACR